MGARIGAHRICGLDGKLDAGRGDDATARTWFAIYVRAKWHHLNPITLGHAIDRWRVRGGGAADPRQARCLHGDHAGAKETRRASPSFRREISEHSTPAIEGLLRNAIIEDTSVALDTVLLDATAVSAIRPAGLRNGVSTLTPTAGGGFAAVVGDIKLLVNALVTSTLGNVRSPVLLMSPALQLALRLTVAPNGTFAFPSVEQGSLLGIPMIVSSNVTADTLYLIDAADLVSASGPPNFSVSTFGDRAHGGFETTSHRYGRHARTRSPRRRDHSGKLTPSASNDHANELGDAQNWNGPVHNRDPTWD